MNHERAFRALHAYADNEVGPVHRFFLSRHIARCPICAHEIGSLRAMRTALRTALPTHRAPPALAARIGAALPREAPPVPVRPRLWAGFAGTGLAGALAGVALTLLVTHASPEPDPLMTDLVEGHVRSLMANHLMDVETSDRHTVKPWLSARLDLSPVVRDLTAEGYPMIGGRLDYIDGHRAAAIVYRRDKHVINLFAFTQDGKQSEPPVLTGRDGFNVIRWRMGGLTYAAVSDVEPSQLMTFVQILTKD